MTNFNSEDFSSNSTAKKQRSIQADQDDRDQKNSMRENTQSKDAVQTGIHDYPQPSFPAQHLEKFGREEEMEVQPQFLAEAYKGSEKLAGMAAIVTGGDSGIGRAVAVLF